MGAVGADAGGETRIVFDEQALPPSSAAISIKARNDLLASPSAPGAIRASTQATSPAPSAARERRREGVEILVAQRRREQIKSRQIAGVS